MKVKELFKNKSDWNQHSWARDCNRNWSHWDNERAICFCLSGAVRKCYSEKGLITPEGEKILILLEKELGNVTEWNDVEGRKFEEVKALVEKLDI